MQPGGRIALAVEARFQILRADRMVVTVTNVVLS